MMASVNPSQPGISVYRLSPGSSSVEMSVGGVGVKAVIDSGAMISILSTRCFEQMKEKPRRVETVRLFLPGEGEMMGQFVKPILMKLGKVRIKQRVCVAPIRDDFLLGHDLLKHWQAGIDWPTDSLIIEGHHIPMEVTFSGETASVARVTTVERIVVPPRTTVRAPCVFKDTQVRPRGLRGDYVVEPRSDLGIKAPEVLCKGGRQPVVLLVNETESFWSVEGGGNISKRI